MQLFESVEFFEPIDQLSHQAWGIKRACCFEQNAHLIAGNFKCYNMIVCSFIFPTMTIILVPVNEQVAMQLLEMVVSWMQILPGVEYRFHYVRITCNLLFIACCKGLDIQIG